MSTWMGGRQGIAHWHTHALVPVNPSRWTLLVWAVTWLGKRDLLHSTDRCFATLKTKTILPTLQDFTLTWLPKTGV
jgi:hypothetical protein